MILRQWVAVRHAAQCAVRSHEWRQAKLPRITSPLMSCPLGTPHPGGFRRKTGRNLDRQRDSKLDSEESLNQQVADSEKAPSPAYYQASRDL
jgi:hypothetical protein